MQFCNQYISVNRPVFFVPKIFKPKRVLCFSSSLESHSSRLALSQTLQLETQKILEWASVCDQLSSFTSTSMGLSAAQSANVPVGQTLEESRKLLNKTAAAVAVMEVMQREAEPLDLSAVENITGIVDSAVSSALLTASELCAVRRTLRAARALFERLKEVAAAGRASSQRFSPLLELLQSCNYQMELERKIGFCIDCNLSRILDRASEDLEIIRSERKRNMENLDSLLKGVAAQIFQAGGIDKPLITQRRSRMCVGVRASHKYLVPDGIILNVSSSGATYFMEPREAVELNNLDVRLSDSERAEEITILSLLTSEVAESEEDIKHMLDRVLEVDLAFARAAYAHWVKGVCPNLTAVSHEDLNFAGSHHSLSVDIEGIRHPLLLGLSLRNSSDAMTSNSSASAESNAENGVTTSRSTTEIASDFPVPIDFKVQRGTSVIVISGPNTGGKTASMKTLGLASLMSKAGMYLPAKKHPKLPWFDLVLADIGDQQSLEQNLSTFGGHILRICKILEVASKETLVLIDEIGSGTDPSEGVALSSSILQYLKDRVNLAVVTTHFADLSRLKDKDERFENAAMEFCHKTLLPTYRILWGSIGGSNALSIAKSIGFDSKIIERAKNWVERLRPENQQERKGQLYQSLLEERKKLQVQVQKAASLHEEIMDLCHEIQKEAEDLDSRQTALMAKETRLVQQELNTAKSQLESVVQEFENQLRTANADQINSLLRKSESAIASIVEAHCSSDNFPATETDVTYTPQVGEQVYVKGLGDKLANVVEAPEDEETVLVQYGKIKARVKKSHIRAIPPSKSRAAIHSGPHLKRQVQLRQEFQSPSEAKTGDDVYGPRVQTSKNAVDLRGMRVEEAAFNLNIAIAAQESHSVLFVIHGVGTGAVKGRALEILKSHPRVAKYEPESPMNYGQATDAVVVVKAYKVLRDRAPYPPDQALGIFKDREESASFRWGLDADGSLVCSDNPGIVWEACEKSSAPFPAGCKFMNGNGLMSFDHPLQKVRAIAREDDYGNISDVTFQVDM